MDSVKLAGFGLVLAGLVFAGCEGGPTKRASGGGEVRTAAAMPGGVEHRATAADLEFVKSESPLAGASAVLWVNGLGCPLCATNVDKQLERVPGVSSVAVDMSSGKVTIGLEGDTRPSPARLAHAVEDAGFTLVKVETR